MFRPQKRCIQIWGRSAIREMCGKDGLFWGRWQGAYEIFWSNLLPRQPVDEDSKPTTNSIHLPSNRQTLGKQQLRPFGLQWTISQLHLHKLIVREMCHLRLRLEVRTQEFHKKKLWKVDLFYLFYLLLESQNVGLQHFHGTQFVQSWATKFSWAPDCPIIFVGFFQINL